MSAIFAQPLQTALQPTELLPLTPTLPLPTCRVCVGVPIRNEAEHLPALVKALAHQVDERGQPLDPASYEVLILANNCSDNSAAIAWALGQKYPALNLQVIEVTLPQPQAHVGQARRLVLNEAYRRLSLLADHPLRQASRDRRLIASTDGDTEVAANWLSSLLNEFDQGVDAICGRILTRRTPDLGTPAKTSLYFLRYMAHRYFTAQLEALLDPLPHDRWPRHYQHFGANLAVSAALYGQVGGVPLVPEQEDVALYHKLQQVDAKIRHSPHVRVITSARRLGRTGGGLAARLNQLTQASREQKAIWVESPRLTEARILLRRQLRQCWAALRQNPSEEGAKLRLNPIATSLGLPEAQLRQQIKTALTFGLLLEAIETDQKKRLDVSMWQSATTEISHANMHLRQRLQSLRQPWIAPVEAIPSVSRSAYPLLETLKQIQPIPLFSLTY
ncbi:glycosyltransferase [Almyronema epifaneia]|uniref:4,4'-diaponeurosporenoate glycosyltransferase n=1 Tax=Almyronema epifaneia S1 TaxID=2991925 RepID=A0ABW6IMY2_9CYAN